MHLKKLELSGFKSFAQKTTLIFNQGVTSIVGPNGCGKSNIVDSVRWVLGEQSLKALRTKRSEDVIFAGSDKKSRAGLASVSLILDNSHGQLPVDWQEVILTRKFFRDGQSEYLLNGSRVRLRDITELLAKSGVSLKNYSIINQGMVDMILRLTPAERRDFFEEAAGVKIYQLKKGQSQRRLKTALGNLERVADLIKEISPRLRSLKIRAGKVKKKEEVRARLKELQKDWFSRLFKEFSLQKSDLETKAKELEGKIKRLMHEQEATKGQFRENEIIDLRHQCQKLEERLESLQDGRNTIQRELALTEGRLAATQERQQGLWQRVSVDPVYTTGKLKEMLSWLKTCLGFSSLEKIKQGIKELLIKIEALLGEIKEGRILKQEKLFSQDKKECSQLEDKKKELSAKLKEIEVNIKTLKEARKQLLTKENKQRESIFSVERQNSVKQGLLDRLRDEKREAEVSLAGLASRLEILMGDIRRELGPSFDINCLTSEVASCLTSEVKQSLEEDIEKLKTKLAQIGEIDPLVVREYEEVNNRYEFLLDQSQDLKKAIRKLASVIKELEIKIDTQFREAFQNINREFAKYFRIMFGGGKASLQVQSSKFKVQSFNEDEDVPRENMEELEETEGQERGGGVIIRAVPPGKKVNSLEALSGGERALVSVALLFAIIGTNPPPFLVLDEVDAALDESNSQRFSRILKESSKRTQFILITHNRETMRQSSSLYGVTMEKNGVSRLLSVKLEDEGSTRLTS